jgi:hypothetical protein
MATISSAIYTSQSDLDIEKPIQCLKWSISQKQLIVASKNLLRLLSVIDILKLYL